MTTNRILADIYDLLQVIHSDICALGGAKPKKIKPYPRPGSEKNKQRRLGQGSGMPLNELREWIRRRQQNG